MKTTSIVSGARVQANRRARFTPIRSLTPETLTSILDSFHAGELRAAALLWEAIEQRDDVLKAVACKRKKAPARFGWEVVADDNSDEALQHKSALENFYRNVDASHACDRNERGGFSLLLRQMMDAVGKRYAVHEIVWRPHPGGELGATFQFVPLWFFENREGQLRFLETESVTRGTELEEDSWLVTTGDGLMEACSIAYLFKHLPLRDWLVYCERNGMPGVRGVTDAVPGTAEWDAARDAVQDFGAEFNALMSRGTDIEAIDLRGSGELPYPALVDRMDKAIATLWRGSSMGTVVDGGAGISLQGQETRLLEREDTVHLSDTLQRQVDPVVIRYRFGAACPRARIVIKHKDTGLDTETVDGLRGILAEGLPKLISTFAQRLIQPPAIEPLLQGQQKRNAN
ncbi:MAG: phage portal protein family protein [Puniceicoccales bacterium]